MSDTGYVLKRDRSVQARRVDIAPEAVAFVVRYRIEDIIKQSEPLTFSEAVERRDLFLHGGLEMDHDGVRIFNGIGPVEGYNRDRLVSQPCIGNYHRKVVTSLGLRAKAAKSRGDTDALVNCHEAFSRILEKVSEEQVPVLTEVYFDTAGMYEFKKVTA